MLCVSYSWLTVLGFLCFFSYKSVFIVFFNMLLFLCLLLLFSLIYCFSEDFIAFLKILLFFWKFYCFFKYFIVFSDFLLFSIIFQYLRCFIYFQESIGVCASRPGPRPTRARTEPEPSPNLQFEPRTVFELISNWCFWGPPRASEASFSNIWNI